MLWYLQCHFKFKHKKKKNILFDATETLNVFYGKRKKKYYFSFLDAWNENGITTANNNIKTNHELQSREKHLQLMGLHILWTTMENCMYILNGYRWAIVIDVMTIIFFLFLAMHEYCRTETMNEKKKYKKI